MPQKLKRVGISCTKSFDEDSCTIDSAVITNSHMGLNVSFLRSVTKTTTLISRPDEPSDEIVIEFNCQVPKSFDHTYEIDLYYKGKKIGTEKINVYVTVTQ